MEEVFSLAKDSSVKEEDVIKDVLHKSYSLTNHLMEVAKKMYLWVPLIEKKVELLKLENFSKMSERGIDILKDLDKFLKRAEEHEIFCKMVVQKYKVKKDE